ncbi:MAG TPA: glutathionylspermidine synthase family protein [Verrucomicrobiae bacterium]|nr:glutathionylspermidine synthase family protein [Verrucomicrobiae bacterium]
MQRHTFSPRPNWKELVEQVGLTFHSPPSGVYWDESAYYELTAKEVDELEAGANTLHQLCIEAAQKVVDNGWWNRLGIPEAAVSSILRSWNEDDFSLYGRFDLAYDGKGPPKLLEYNADTPTALIEAAVAQWFWLQSSFSGLDQFNSIHERLIAAWKQLGSGRIYFSSIREFAEDEQTALYLQDTCHQAGLETTQIFIEDIGWDAQRERFVDLDGVQIERCFKLYPWEWMWHEQFAQYLSQAAVRWIEPAWKMLLSNKGLLPILWELFPGHPNLLPCFDSPAPLAGTFVRKPKLSREGSNITVVEGGRTVESTGGEYGEEGFVYQAVAPCEEFAGNHPVLGVWIIAHEAAGVGIREDTSRITGNQSRFVPHLFYPR